MPRVDLGDGPRREVSWKELAETFALVRIVQARDRLSDAQLRLMDPEVLRERVKEERLRSKVEYFALLFALGIAIAIFLNQFHIL